MTPQYHTLNDCLRLLKCSIIPLRARLLIEVKLLRVKMLLLDRDEHCETASEGPDEEIYQHLLELMRMLSTDVHDKIAVADMSERVETTLKDLHVFIDGIMFSLAP